MMPRQAVMSQRMAGAGALKEYLGLTDAQVEQMRDLRRKEASGTQAQSAVVRAKALELRQLMRSESPDPAKVGALTIELKEMREEAAAARGGLSDQTKAVLTADQQAKLKQLEETVRLGPAARQAVALGLVDAPRTAGLAGGEATRAERWRGRGRARM